MEIPFCTLRDVVELPAYWRGSARARRQLPPHRRLAYGPHPRQYALLLEPRGVASETPLPWAVYLHGGAWTFGTPEAFRPAARAWLAAGFRVLLPSYRRPPRVTLGGIVEDCWMALEYAAAFAERTGRPLGPVQVGGISAGGHLAALLALQPSRWGAAGWPAGPHRALLCAAPTDFSILRPRPLFSRRKAQDPLQQLEEAREVEWLLLHGKNDGMVAYAHSLHFARALREREAAVELVTIPKGGHLASGRWTYDAQDAYAHTVATFIRQGLGGLRGRG